MAIKLWHIAPDLRVKPCSAQSPEACPYSRSEELNKYGIKIHYESIVRPQDAENVAKILKMIDSKSKAREIYAQGERSDFDTISLVHGEHYNNFQQIYSHFLAQTDENGEGEFSGRKTKRLSTGMLKFNSDNGEKYNIVAERMTGTHKDYIYDFVPFVGADYESELTNNGLKYESLEKLEDGSTRLTLKDPFKNRPTWAIWRLDKTTQKKELAYHFSGDDIDATFGNFMETGGLQGFEGPRMWSSPEKTFPIEDSSKVKDILTAVAGVERILNSKFYEENSVLKINESENAIDLNFKGYLSDGLTPTQIQHAMRKARFNNPKSDLSFTYDVIDDRQKHAETGWNSSWGIKKTEDGLWVFRGRPSKDEYYEEVLDSAEEAKHFIDVFEAKHYDLSRDQNPGFRGEYVSKIMKVIDLELSNKPEAFSHYKHITEKIENSPAIFEETKNKKKKGFFSLFS